MTLSITGQSAYQYCALYHLLFTIMLSVIMLRVVMLNVVMLNVVMLSLVAPSIMIQQASFMMFIVQASLLMIDN
jgi:hypothetical protein